MRPSILIPEPSSIPSAHVPTSPALPLLAALKEAAAVTPSCIYLEEAVQRCSIAAALTKGGFGTGARAAAIVDLLWFLFRVEFDSFHRSSRPWRIVLNQVCSDLLEEFVHQDVRYCCYLFQSVFPVEPLLSWTTAQSS